MLSTSRLTLVPLSPAHYAALREGRPGLETLLGVRLDPEWPTFSESISHFDPVLHAGTAVDGWGTWIVIHAVDHVVIGEGGFKGEPDDEGAVEIGYAIVPSRRRLGYAGEFARALVERAFADQRVRLVRATTLADGGDSEASQAVLRRLGFVRGEEGEEEGMRIVGWLLPR